MILNYDSQFHFVINSLAYEMVVAVISVILKSKDENQCKFAFMSVTKALCCARYIRSHMTWNQIESHLAFINHAKSMIQLKVRASNTFQIKIQILWL